MKSYEVLKKLNYIGNNTADVKVIINDKELDIQDIKWTGWQNGGKIIIKVDDSEG
jgi:hypothetical protein